MQFSAKSISDDHAAALSELPESHQALDRFAEQAGQLYSLPTVAIEILQLTAQPKVEIAALKKCLLRDPALVGKMLRVVNSSLFGLSREVCDLNQALALLGTKSVRLLVLGFSLPDKLFAGLAGDVLNRYWHHTAIKAAAAREISEAIYHLPGDEAFMAGLLQDLGMLVLLQQVGEPYVKYLRRAFAKSVDVAAAEAVTLGFDHVQLTVRLLQRWGLPESLVTAIGAGTSAKRIEQLPPAQRALPQILHLADLLAGMLMEGRADWLGQLLHVGQTYHELTKPQLTDLVGALQAKVGQLADALSLDLPQGIDYTEIYREAHRQLSAAAEDAAIDLTGAKGSLVGSAGGKDVGDEEDLLLGETKSLAAAVRRFTHPTHKQLAPRAAARTATVPTAASRAAPQTKLPAGSEIASAESAATAVDSATAESPVQIDLPSQEPIEQPQADSSHSDALLIVVARSIANCRDARIPLSLILVEVDRTVRRAGKDDAGDARRLVQLVGLVCGKIDHRRLVQLPAADNRLALVLPDCDRPAARVIGHFVLDEVRRLSGRQPELAQVKLSVSVGVATVAMPAKNFPTQSLIGSAERCLHSAQLSGGNAVKSIDVL